MAVAVVGKKPFCLRSKAVGGSAQIRQADASQCHLIRRIVILSFEGLFSPDQLDYLEMWLGEAVVNAFKHAIKGSYIIVEANADFNTVSIAITNASNGYRGEIPEIDTCSESGRGRQMMEAAVTKLRDLGLEVKARCQFFPCRRFDCGKTVVSLSCIF